MAELVKKEAINALESMPDDVASDSLMNVPANFLGSKDLAEMHDRYIYGNKLQKTC